MTDPVLPRLEIPENTLLLHEDIAIDDSDRTRNRRFLITKDGGFHFSRNTELYVDDPDLIDSDEPDLHWNKPLRSHPIRQLSKSQIAKLSKAIQAVDLPQLAKYYLTAEDEAYSHPSVERWTMIHDNTIYTIIVQDDEAPPALVKLRQKIDELVANAPRVQVPD
jgi:hypothetical protein